MDSKKAPPVNGIDPVLAAIQQRLQARPKEWLKALQENPGALAARSIGVRLLGGLLIDVTTLYCSPAQRSGKGRGKNGSGLYPELGVLDLQRAGTMPAGAGQGKRLGAMIDGGRTKLRKTTRQQKGQGKTRTQKRRYQTEWQCWHCGSIKGEHRKPRWWRSEQTEHRGSGIAWHG